jgi:hypothetical protein
MFINYRVFFYRKPTGTFFSTLLTEDRTEFMEKEEWKMENTNLTVSDTDVENGKYKSNSFRYRCGKWKIQI